MAKELTYSPDLMMNEAAEFVVKFAKLHLDEGNDPRNAMAAVMQCCAKYVAACFDDNEAGQMVTMLAVHIMKCPENYPSGFTKKEAKP